MADLKPNIRRSKQSSPANQPAPRIISLPPAKTIAQAVSNSQKHFDAAKSE